MPPECVLKYCMFFLYKTCLSPQKCKIYHSQMLKLCIKKKHNKVNMTYGTDIKSLLKTHLDSLKAEESQGSSWPYSQEIHWKRHAARASWQVPVKPLIHSTWFNIAVFHHSILFASMPLVQLKPVWQRYVASHETTVLVAVRAPATCW